MEGRTGSAPCSFTARQASEITGVTYDLIDYYAKRGLVVPSVNAGKGRGAERRYSFNDLVALMMVRVTRVADVGFEFLQPAVELIQRTPSLEGHDLLVIGAEPDFPARDLLVIDYEKRAYFAEYVVREGTVQAIRPLAADGRLLPAQPRSIFAVQTGIAEIVEQIQRNIERLAA